MSARKETHNNPWIGLDSEAAYVLYKNIGWLPHVSISSHTEMETDRIEHNRIESNRIESNSCIRGTYGAFYCTYFWLYTKHKATEPNVMWYISDCFTSFVCWRTLSCRLDSFTVGKCASFRWNWVSRTEYALRTGSSQRTFSFRQEIQLFFLF